MRTVDYSYCAAPSTPGEGWYEYASIALLQPKSATTLIAGAIRAGAVADRRGRVRRDTDFGPRMARSRQCALRRCRLVEDPLAHCVLCLEGAGRSARVIIVSGSENRSPGHTVVCCASAGRMEQKHIPLVIFLLYSYTQQRKL